MSRLQPVDVATMDEGMREEWDSLVRWRKGEPPGGMFGGPFDAWFRSPEFCHQMRVFGLWFWEKTSVDRGLIELAISIAAYHWQSNVEWSHANTAIRFGIEESVLEEVKAGKRPTSSREDVRLIYDLSMAFLQNKSLSDALYEKAKATWGERGITEIAGVLGFYTMVAFTLRAYDIEPSEEGRQHFARPEEADWRG